MAVAPKKDKFIEEAQKLALRGQYDKAVKLYEQAMALEPSNINLRQKLAELLIKGGRPEDARKEFEIVGKHFATNGFYLKAIAVYKQLQKLFPADISLSITLAELNEKHGLTANAIAEYKLVYDYYQKTGNTAELIKTLDKMQTVDSGNVAIKIKLAETLFQNDRKDEAYALFSKTASLLQENGDNATLSRLNERIQELFPEKTEFVLETLAEQVKSGNAAKAVAGLQGLLRSNTGDKRVWDLVIEAYRRLNQPQRVRIAYQHYLKYFPNDPTPMSGLITCCAEDGDSGAALELLERFEPQLLSAGRLDDLEKIYRTLDATDPINIRVLEGLVRVSRAAGKTDQLETFASRLRSLSGVSGLPQADAADSAETETAEIEPPELHDAGDDTLITAEELAPDDEEIEIEIDIDIDSDADFEPPAGDSGEDGDGADWPDSVDGLFDSITAAPRGVRFGNEMDSSDAQSHFDLGLAFREMGLYDEAINEFRQAASDASRRRECLIMQGACLRERGQHDAAITLLKSLLKPGLSREDSSAVKYELALTYEATGKSDQTTQLLNEIDASTPGFRDVSSRLNAANLEDSLDFSDEDLKDFDLK